MAISYEPELLARARSGAEARLDRRARAAPAHVDHRAARAARDDGGGPRGQDASAPPGSPTRRPSCSTALQAAGVNPASVKEVNVGFNLVPAMLSGKVAATLGGFWNYEAIQLRLLHKRPIVIPVDRAGVPTYDELVLVVREDRGAHERTGPARVPAGAHAGRARGAGRPCRRRPRSSSRPTRRSNPSSSWHRFSRRFPPRCRPPTPGRSASRAPRHGRPSAAGCSRTNCSQHDPNAALPPFTNEFLPGQGI